MRNVKKIWSDHHLHVLIEKCHVVISDIQPDKQKQVEVLIKTLWKYLIGRVLQIQYLISSPLVLRISFSLSLYLSYHYAEKMK